tara:strand:- start:45080 stop:45640 length:561 start_codon:yes stop_codon:yes gene_type:complete
MRKIKYNKSKTYLLPLLAELVNFDRKFFRYLVNTYIFDGEGQYKDCIFMLHDFSFKNPEFTAYEHKFIESELFVDLIDIGNQVLYIFKFPEEYLHEYKMFKLGKYSYYGEDAKEQILAFYTNIYKGNINAVEFLIKIKHILFKDEKLKRKIERELKVTLRDDAELTDIMKPENETYILSKKEENAS